MPCPLESKPNRLPRVQLVERPKDRYTSLRSGDEGQVTGYDFDNDLVEVDWDNGSKLPVSVRLLMDLDA